MIRCRLFGHRFRWYRIGAAASERTVVLCERCGKAVR